MYESGDSLSGLHTVVRDRGTGSHSPLCGEKNKNRFTLTTKLGWGRNEVTFNQSDCTWRYTTRLVLILRFPYLSGPQSDDLDFISVGTFLNFLDKLS